MPTVEEKMDKFKNLRITDRNYDAIKNMHHNWYYTAIKDLLVSWANSFTRSFPKVYEQKRLARCLDKIEDKKDLMESAKCVVGARKRHMAIKLKKYSAPSNPSNLIFLPENDTPEVKDTRTTEGKKVQWVGSLQVLLKGKSREVPRIISTQSNGHQTSGWPQEKEELNFLKGSNKPAILTDLSSVSGKTTLIGKQNEKIGRQRIGKPKHKRLDKYSNDSYRRRAKRISNRLKEKEFEENNNGVDMEERIFKRLKPDINGENMFKVQSRRELDGLIAKNDKSVISRVSQLIHQLAAPSATNETMETKQTWSKTFGSLTKLHNLDEKRKKLPSAWYDGVSETDRQNVISMLMDVSRTTQEVDKGIGILEEMHLSSADVGTPIVDATERVVNAFQSVEDSFCVRQRREIRQNGYSFLKKAQMEQLIRDQKVSNPEEIDLSMWIFTTK
uniref:Uncharacterized protein n=1 Tax=Ditylenchus dipsaci TaxID=166011 RepID=A0A915CVY8_9BILA